MTPFYRTVSLVARWLLLRLVRVEVHGVENVPAQGPFVLVPNHQSLLDPVAVQTFCPRQVHSMTKSSQFGPAFFRWILPRVGAFPARRYRVDPQSVRVTLRHLEKGRGVCVYPEGERSWDGTLQPFRRGTLRVLLRAGVPVVPVGIEGTYDAWPRWLRRPRRGHTVTLRFGAPLHFGEHRQREAREEALPETDRTLREALLRLSGEAEREAGGNAEDGATQGLSADPEEDRVGGAVWGGRTEA